MAEGSPQIRPEQVSGRYALYRRIASGGMASVHLGRLFGLGGFSRVVAIKRLHPQFAADPAFVMGFVDEARMASRVRHPNVVPVIDVVSEGDTVLLVMEYVHGEKLSALMKQAAERGLELPPEVVVAIAADALRGLHAAHEATAPDGRPLGLVHRDVSPQNILVSSEGIAQLVDFGIAKALGRSQTTREGQIKGKLAYMAYEQLSGGEVTRRTDVYAMSIVLWEMACGQRLFSGDSDAAVYSKIMQHAIPQLDELRPDLPPGLAGVIMRGLCRDPKDRFASALEMASALEAVVRPATRASVSTWVQAAASAQLRERAALVAEIEQLDEPSSPEPALAEAAVASSEALAESTQVSTIGVSRPAISRRSARRPLLIWLGGAVMLAALAGLLLLSLWRGAPGSGASDSAAAAEPAASHLVAPQPAAPPAPLAPPSALAQQPSASAETPSAPSSAAPPAPAPNRLAPRKPAAKPAKLPCKYRDADGIWHVRPDCL